MVFNLQRNAQWLCLCSVILIILGIIRFWTGTLGIVTGVLTVLLGFFGLWGTIRKNYKFLLFFIIGCFIVFVLSVVNLVLYFTGGGNVGIKILGIIMSIISIVFYAYCMYLAFVVRGRSLMLGSEPTGDIYAQNNAKPAAPAATI